MKILVLSNSFCNYGIDGKPGDMLREAGFGIDVNKTGKKYLESDLLPIIDQYDAVIVGADEVTTKVIEKGTKLKIIAKNGVGYDNIDIPTATQKNIFVTYTPGAVEQTVADSTFGMIIDLARNLTFGDRAIRKSGWKRARGTEVWEKKLGIIGLGKIGKGIAHRARGFDMDVYAFDPFIDKDYCEENNITLLELDDIFRMCDFISIHCLLNEETKHLVNERRLKLMQKTAFLINTSRGGVIDEAALYAALKANQIAGAGLDVFETEPLPNDSPLFQLDNLLMASHNAGHSFDANLKAGVMVAESVIAALNGRTPLHLLNSEVIGGER